jgi:LMBR1 domain-containing protein 1
MVKVWLKIEAVFRPLKLVGGLLFLLLALFIFTSMLITGVDKAKNSICKAHCGYILGHINIFQPINWIFVKSAKVFPVDYALFLLLVLFFFAASIVGIASIGIRFLWLTLFKIRKGHTSPQALLMATVMLTLIVLAINYSVAMVVAPQYATFGPQTYCDPPSGFDSCETDHSWIKPCSELAKNPNAKEVCTPSVISTFINRVTINFPFFGVVLFWGQFAFLGVYLVVFVTTLFRIPQLDQDQIDRDLEEEEEEGLLASTGRRFGATWQDITGRAKKNNYGSTETNGERA